MKGAAAWLKEQEDLISEGEKEEDSQSEGSSAPIQTHHVTMETRYVTITLPEDGGNSFQWTVDGIERSFVAPDGKHKGAEHEFVCALAFDPAI